MKNKGKPANNNWRYSVFFVLLLALGFVINWFTQDKGTIYQIVDDSVVVAYDSSQQPTSSPILHENLGDLVLSQYLGDTIVVSPENKVTLGDGWRYDYDSFAPDGFINQFHLQEQVDNMLTKIEGQVDLVANTINISFVFETRGELPAYESVLIRASIQPLD